MTTRPKNEALYWVMRLLQDEGWSLWESSDHHQDAKILYDEAEIEFPGEQKALVRVIECEKREE